MLGPERRSHLLSEEEKKITAYHETGHALVARLLPHGDPVKKISIISRGLAAGYTWSAPDEDKHLYTKSEFEDKLASLLGGKAAEEIIYGESSTGAENDLRKATQMAREMVKEYGMSDILGPVTYGRKEELVFLGKEIGEEKTYSEKTAAEIDEEIRRILERAFFTAKKVLAGNRPKLELIAKTLLQKETLEGEEFEKLFLGKEFKTDEKICQKPKSPKKPPQKGLRIVKKVKKAFKKRPRKIPVTYPKAA